jgi:hypothetical protein
MRARVARLAAGLLAACLAACSNPFAPEYEYDEQIYLSVSGQATVVVNSSLVALVALRGANIDAAYDTKEDRASIRRLYESGGCTVDSVSRFWSRHGRRFVQVQVSTDDVRTLSKCALTSWSTYELGPKKDAGNVLTFRQVAGPPSGKPPAAAKWNGSELVAFKLHAPSRIHFQNVRNLQDGTPGNTERGNILTWEQRLADRLAGAPIEMHVEMDSTSILYTTLWLFVGAFAAAVLMLGLIIWWTIRRGRRGIVPGKS